MKRSLRLVPLFILFVSALQAQIIAPNNYLQSAYMEVGVCEKGIYITDVPSPLTFHGDTLITEHAHIDSTYYYWEVDTLTGYYDSVSCFCWVDSIIFDSTTLTGYYYSYTYDTARAPLGIIFDSDMDGWDTGSPADHWGDASMPGTANEGFGIEVNGNSYKNEMLPGNGDFDIPGSNMYWNHTGDTTRAVWIGAIPSQDIYLEQFTLMPDNKLFFYTRVLLRNSGTEPAADVYYCRNIDPDQEVRAGASYETYNKIVFNNPADSVCLVSAEGAFYGDNFVMLGSSDARARVSQGNFFIGEGPFNKVSNAWNGLGGYDLENDGSIMGDLSIQISFNLGTIAPGDSAVFTFAYIFSNESSVVEEALKALLCLPATDAIVADLSETSALVTWSGSDATDYLVEWKKAGTAVWSSATTTDLFYTISGLDLCTDYVYRVTNMCDVLSPTEEVSFKTLCTDAVQNIAFSSLLYPNPANGTCMLTTDINGEATVQVRDMAGNIVYAQTLQLVAGKAQPINIEHAEQGIYTVQVTSGGYTSTQKLMINQ